MERSVPPCIIPINLDLTPVHLKQRWPSVIVDTRSLRSYRKLETVKRILQIKWFQEYMPPWILFGCITKDSNTSSRIRRPANG